MRRVAGGMTCHPPDAALLASAASGCRVLSQLRGNSHHASGGKDAHPYAAPSAANTEPRAAGCQRPSVLHTYLAGGKSTWKVNAKSGGEAGCETRKTQAGTDEEFLLIRHKPRVVVDRHMRLPDGVSERFSCLGVLFLA